MHSMEFKHWFFLCFGVATWIAITFYILGYIAGGHAKVRQLNKPAAPPRPSPVVTQEMLERPFP